MDKIKQAAIIMIGMGERCAAEILKNMNPKEVEAIMNSVNSLETISEAEVIQTLNAFFKDTHGSAGIDLITKEVFKNSVLSIVESKKIETVIEGNDQSKIKWFDVFKLQSSDIIFSILQDEHPQVIAVTAAFILPSDKASILIKRLPKELKNSVIARMASIEPISTFGMESLSALFERELHNKNKYDEITINGVEAIASIISHLDSENEKEIIDELSKVNSNLSEAIQERIMPFEKLTLLDKKSLQTLLSEVSSEDLVLALKGSEAYIKNAFLKNMASKSADILKDELESKGPVKISHVLDAQKRIVLLSKKLSDEDKVILPTKVESDFIY